MTAAAWGTRPEDAVDIEGATLDLAASLVGDHQTRGGAEMH